MKIPKLFRKYIEEHGGTYREYVIMRLQFSVIFMFILALVLTIKFNMLIFSILLLLFVLNTYSTIKQFKDERDGNAYVFFFCGLSLIAVSLGALRYFVDWFSAELFLFYLITFILFAVVFKLVFGRNYTFGKVLLSSKEWAVVQVPFDIRSSVRNDYYAVRSKANIKKGDMVKIKIERGFLGRGKIWRIVGKSKL
ncbi:MAG: DUF2101 family protein [Candidatus Diapherotrites archaeon]|nr:DUF2101 family protein [Candidatus Diapherotrites archaeon]